MRLYEGNETKFLPIEKFSNLRKTILSERKRKSEIEKWSGIREREREGKRTGKKVYRRND